MYINKSMYKNCIIVHPIAYYYLHYKNGSEEPLLLSDQLFVDNPLAFKICITAWLKKNI